ncbi:hypothetical protein [Marinobacter sp. M5B]|uniref:hypothetical protein n=1 Tax=Marinobacter sp. M5B TaxID=3141535 RepID=UPI0036D309A5
MSTINLDFDEKTNDIIIWNGQVVMSRTEEQYFEKLFARLEYLQPKSVLEIGFGLGISSALIQKYLMPEQHDIYEIESNIYNDLERFANKHTTVRPFFDDWLNATIQQTYDFIFYDPYDYFPDQDRDSFRRMEAQMRLKSILTPTGVLCHPHFGDGAVPDIQGFDTVVVDRFKVNSIRMADNTECQDVAIVYHLAKA